MSADSADLATSAAADAPLGDLCAADGDEIMGTSFQKNESAFLVFLKHTWSAGTNLGMKIIRLKFCNLCKIKKIKIQNSLWNVLQKDL